MNHFDFDQKRKTRRILFAPITIVFLVFLALFLSNAVWNAYKEYSDARAREERAEEDLADLLFRQQELTKEIERLRTDRGFEEEVRKQLGFGREGEGVVIVVDKENDTGVNKNPLSWWDKLIGFFK